MAIVLVFLLVLYSFSSSSSTMLTKTAKDVFILAGGSNMVGYGGVEKHTWDGVVPPECQPDTRILRLGQDMEWEDAHEPLHNLVDNTSTSTGVFGIGPGMPFANFLLQRVPTIGTIGLVPCAVASILISNWSRDSYNYKNMVARAQAAIADGGVLRAFLWYHGEYDSTNATTALAYRRRLVELFVDLRADLHSHALPIIEVALASGSFYIEYVREAQLQAAGLLFNVECVDAHGLPLNPEYSLRLTTLGQIKLGSMLAEAYLHFSSGVEDLERINFALLLFYVYIFSVIFLF